MTGASAKMIRLALHLFIVSLVFNSLAFSQSGMTLTGIVIDSARASLPDVSVRLYSVDRVLEAKTNADGIVKFPNLPPGKYEAEASSPGFMTKNLENIGITDRAPEPFLIQFDGTGVVIGGHCPVLPLDAVIGSYPWEVVASYQERSGKTDVIGVVRDTFGEPLSAFTLSLDREGVSHSAVSDDRGQFAFTGLEPGRYILRSSQPGYWEVHGTVWITHDDVARVLVTSADKSHVTCVR
jgi:hypothetical protein